MVSLEDFKKRANLTDVEIIEYNGFKKQSKFKCKKHGEFYKTPKNFLLHQCNECTNERLHNLYSKSQSTFLKQAKDLFPNFDYSKVNYYNDSTNITVICKKHGEFNTTPNRLLSKHECPACANEKRIKQRTYTLEELILRANKVHNNKYTYKSKLTGINSEAEIVCKKHGSFFMSWNNHINGKQKCPNCYSSQGEEKVELFLKNNNISFKKRKEYPDLKDKNNLSYDFYIPSKNLLIECQGQQHYYNSFKKPLHEFHRQLHHDWLKRRYAKINKINLLTIPYWEYNNIREILEEKIGLL